jgi:hypothetical protein
LYRRDTRLHAFVYDLLEGWQAQKLASATRPDYEAHSSGVVWLDQARVRVIRTANFFKKGDKKNKIRKRVPVG